MQTVLPDVAYRIDIGAGTTRWLAAGTVAAAVLLVLFLRLPEALS